MTTKGDIDGFGRNVLVTGGTGTIGRRVVRFLSENNWKVTVLTRQPNVSWRFDASRVKTVFGDLCDERVVKTIIGESDAVCHLAAYIPRDFDDPLEARQCVDVNSLATLRIALLATDKKVRFVSCASAQAYLYSPTPVLEDWPLYPAERATYYLSSKVVGELYVEHLRLSRALQAITLRVASVYGPGMPERSVVSSFMRSAMSGMPLIVRDGGTPTLDLVYVDDVAWLIVNALSKGTPGVYNAGSGVSTSVLSLANAVQSICSDRMASIDARPSAGRPPASFSPLSMEKARSEWQHSPTPLHKGLLAFKQQMEMDNSANCDF